MSSSIATASPSNAPQRHRRGLLHLINAWVPVLICVLVIAAESTPMFGSDRTTAPLQHFFESLLHRHFTEPQWWKIHIMIRKSGHFLGYGIVSLAWFRAFWMTWKAFQPFRRRELVCHALAMLGTLALASSDEFHQLFLPNRTGSIWDVMTDCGGALLVQSFIWLWLNT